MNWPPEFDPLQIKEVFVNSAYFPGDYVDETQALFPNANVVSLFFRESPDWCVMKLEPAPLGEDDEAVTTVIEDALPEGRWRGWSFEGVIDRIVERPKWVGITGHPERQEPLWASQQEAWEEWDAWRNSVPDESLKRPIA